MASELVNVNSALNYMATKTGLPINVVRGWFPNESTQRSAPLNVRSAFKILNRCREIGFGSVASNTSAESNTNACSVNTLKSLYNYIFKDKTWKIEKGTSQMSYEGTYFALTPASVTMTIYGGGGGASGCCAVYTAKNAPHTVVGGAGAKGGDTTVFVGSTLIATAKGGAGAPRNSQRGGANNNWNRFGNGAGSQGETKTGVVVNLKVGEKFSVSAGTGGSGGGGTESYRADYNPGNDAVFAVKGGPAMSNGETTGNTVGGHAGGGVLVPQSGGEAGSGGGHIAGTNGTCVIKFGTFAPGAGRAGPTTGGNSFGAPGRAVGANFNGTAADGGFGGASGGCVVTADNNAYYNRGY